MNKFVDVDEIVHSMSPVVPIQSRVRVLVNRVQVLSDRPLSIVYFSNIDGNLSHIDRALMLDALQRLND